MDKTQAINPSNKAKLVIAVQRYEDLMDSFSDKPIDKLSLGVAKALKLGIGDAAIKFILSEEG